MKHDSPTNQVKRFAAMVLIVASATLPAMAQFTSSYAQIAVAGSFNGFDSLTPNMTLIAHNTWQADLVITSNAQIALDIDPSLGPNFYKFKFATPGYALNWGLTPPTNTLPMAFTANVSIPPDIFSPPDIYFTNTPITVIESGVTNIITNTQFRFIFNDASREYAVFLLNNLEAETLLYNGSFETTAESGPVTSRALYWFSGLPNNHGEMLGNARRASYSTNAFNGSWIMDIRGLGSGARNTSGTIWQETPAQAGVTYEASARFLHDDPLNSWTGAIRQLRLDYFDFNRTNTLASFVADLSDLPVTGTNIAWIPRNITGIAPAGTAWARFTVLASEFGSNGYLRVDDARLNAFVAKRTEDFNEWGLITLDGNYTRGGWTINSGRTVSGTPLARSGFAASLANPGASNVGGFVRSPRFSDGVGTVRFWYRQGPAYDPFVDTNEPVRMAVQVSTLGDFWTTIGETNVVFNQNYQEFIGSAPVGTFRFLRILHAGGSANRLLIDDISVTATEGQPRLMDFDNWPPANPAYAGWSFSNGVASASLALSGQSGQIAGGTNIGAFALYSPVFNNGIGPIRFNYRSGIDSARTLGFLIQARAHPGTNWVEIDRVTNITSLVWEEYERFEIKDTPHQVRIVNLAETNANPAIATNIFEGFSGGATNPPPGWIFSGISAVYTTAASSGVSGPPSLALQNSGARIVTPGLVNPTNIGFMVRGQSTDPANSFLVEGMINGAWVTITNLIPISNSRIYFNIPVTTAVSQVRFTYTKVADGNLAFDDFRMTGMGFATNVPQRLLLDNVLIDNPFEYRLQDFNTWPTKPEISAGVTFHQGWRLTGPSRILPAPSISGNALTLGRYNVDGGGNIVATPSYTADFEDATKTSYAAGTITNNGVVWNTIEALVGTSTTDWKNGARSIRMRGYGASEIFMMQNWTNGLSSISFNYGRYGTDPQAAWQVQLSTNSGSTWFNVGATFTPGIEPDTFSLSTNISGNLRVKIRNAAGTGSSNQRMNIDDITLIGTGSGGAPTNGMLHAHYLPGGVGSVRFQYRHSQQTPPASDAILAAAIQTSTNGTTWTTRNALVISNIGFQSYETFLNLTNDYYFRLAITNGFGEALFDNVEVFAPQPPATVVLNGYNDPEIPFSDNEVTLKASVTPLYGAANVTVTSYYRIGTSGVFNAIPMTSIGGNEFAATTNIPPQPIGTLVQYWMSATFSGPGANLTSPVTYPAGAPTNAVASYGIPRNPPGKVWINEVDYYAEMYDPDENCDGWSIPCTNYLRYDFIELAGFEGVDLTGWSIEIYNGSVNPAELVAKYMIVGTLTNEINGFGFFLMAGSGFGIPPSDMTLTNYLYDADPGGILLLNEFGGVEDAWSYSGVIPNFSEILTLDRTDLFYEDSLTNSISLIGTSAGRDFFTWGSTTTYPTPGATNVGQVFAQPASIGVSTNKLTFNYYQGSLNSPSPQTLVVSNAGVSALTYTVASTPSWVTVEPFSAITLSAGQSRIHTVRVDTASLNGTRTGYLTIDGQADNSPFIVNIEAKPVELQPAIIHYAFKTERIDTGTKTVLNDGSLGSLADLDLINGAEFSLAGRGITGTRNDIAYEPTTTNSTGVAGVLTNLNGIQRFTISGWINPPTTSSLTRVIMGNRSNTNGFQLRAHPHGNQFRQLSLLASGSTNAMLTSTNFTMPSNTWTFFAVTFDGTATSNAVKFYSGGVSNTLVLNATTTRVANTIGTGISTNLFRVGSDGALALPAMLDDLRIYAELLDENNLEEVRRSGATSYTGTGTEPGFLAQPQGGTYTIAQIGVNHTFSITTSGDPVPGITWRKNGVVIPGATLSSYTIAVNYPTVGFYDAILDNGFGRVTSNVAEIQFQIDFITQPITNIFLYPGDTARFFAQLTPGSNTYQWYSNSVAIVGATATNLVVSNVTNTNKPGYYLVASNKTGVVTSHTVRLNVIDLLFKAEGGARGIAPPTTSTNVVLSWPSMSNYTYDVFWTTNLMAGTNSFVRIATNLPATPAVNIWTDRVHGAKGVGFYRLRSTQQ